MTSKADALQKVEAYAHSLLDAARGKGEVEQESRDVRKALKFSPEIRDVLKRMEKEKDLPLLEQLYNEVKNLITYGDQVATVTVTTAMRMNAELRGKVRAKCEEDLGVPVRLVERVDPKIMGGIILETNGHRRDASVRAQLVNIRKTLSSSYQGSAEA